MKRIWAGVAALAAASVALTAPASSAAPLRRGVVSVAGAAFSDDSGEPACRVAKGPFASYRPDPEASDVDCDLVAGIHLPEGAELSSLRCSLYDNDITNAIEAHLVRVELASGDLDTVFTTPGTADGGLQMVTDATAEPFTRRVANGKYAYYLAAAFGRTDFSTVGVEMRVYGCTVAYE